MTNGYPGSCRHILKYSMKLNSFSTCEYKKECYIFSKPVAIGVQQKTIHKKNERTHLFFDNLSVYKPATQFKKRLRYNFYLVSYATFFRKTFLWNTHERLLLFAFLVWSPKVATVCTIKVSRSVNITKGPVLNCTAQ